MLNCLPAAVQRCQVCIRRTGFTFILVFYFLAGIGCLVRSTSVFSTHQGNACGMDAGGGWLVASVISFISLGAVVYSSGLDLGGHKELQEALDDALGENVEFRRNNMKLEDSVTELRSIVELSVENQENFERLLEQLRTSYLNQKKENDRHTHLNRQQARYQLLTMYRDWSKDLSKGLMAHELSPENLSFLKSVFPQLKVHVLEEELKSPGGVSFDELVDICLAEKPKAYEGVPFLSRAQLEAVTKTLKRGLRLQAVAKTLKVKTGLKFVKRCPPSLEEVKEGPYMLVREAAHDTEDALVQRRELTVSEFEMLATRQVVEGVLVTLLKSSLVGPDDKRLVARTTHRILYPPRRGLDVTTGGGGSGTQATVMANRFQPTPPTLQKYIEGSEDD